MKDKQVGDGWRLEAACDQTSYRGEKRLFAHTHTHAQAYTRTQMSLNLHTSADAVRTLAIFAVLE